MDVLLPNFPEENVVREENVHNFKINKPKGASSNVFQILQDLQLKQYKGQYHLSTVPNTALKQYKGQYHSSTIPSTTPKQYEEQYHSNTTHINLEKSSSTTNMVQNMAQSVTSFRTTTPSTATNGRTTTKQVNPIQVDPDISHESPLRYCMHVHQPTVQVCKPGESLALRKVKHPHNGRTSVNRLPLTKQDILSQYSGCFECVGHFQSNSLYFRVNTSSRVTIKVNGLTAGNMHQRKFQSTLNPLLRRKLNQGILEEVKEHTDWVNSYVIVEKDTGNHHLPNSHS